MMPLTLNKSLLLISKLLASFFNKLSKGTKSQKGRACAALIQQVLGNKKVFVFGELLSIPSVASLKESDEFVKHHSTLELFAYGVFDDYKSNPSMYLELHENQLRKLKILTLLTLASKSNKLPYDYLKQALSIGNIRELEDLIIEAIYQNLIAGKLDHVTNTFSVKSSTARDVPVSSLPNIIEAFKKWKESCQRAESALERVSINMKRMREKGVSEQEASQEIMKSVRASLKETMARGPESSRTSGYHNLTDGPSRMRSHK